MTSENNWFEEVLAARTSGNAGPDVPYGQLSASENRDPGRPRAARPHPHHPRRAASQAATSTARSSPQSPRPRPRRSRRTRAPRRQSRPDAPHPAGWTRRCSASRSCPRRQGRPTPKCHAHREDVHSPEDVRRCCKSNDFRHDQLLSAGHSDHGPESVEKRVAKPACLSIQRAPVSSTVPGVTEPRRYPGRPGSLLAPEPIRANRCPNRLRPE